MEKKHLPLLHVVVIAVLVVVLVLEQVVYQSQGWSLALQPIQQRVLDYGTEAYL